MAPPVFKTGLAGIAFAGRFDSFPPPPLYKWFARVTSKKCSRLSSMVAANQRFRSKCTTTTSEY